MRGTVSSRKSIPWRVVLLLVFVLGILNGVYWAHHKKERYYEGQDSFEYRLLATNMLDGRGFSREVQPPFVQTLFREPGYPAFLAVVLEASGRNDEVVAFAQALLIGVSAVLTALLGRAVFGDAIIAALAGVAVALSPDLGDHSRYEMSEALYVPLLLLATLYGFHAWRANSTKRSAIAGVLFALAGYVKVMTFGMSALLALAAAVLDRWHGRSSWRGALALIAAMLLTAAPWIARNEIQLGQLSFTGRSGGFVIPRADKAALPPDKQWALVDTAVWVVTYPFSSLVVPTSTLYTPPNIWDGPLGDLELQETNRGFARHCSNMPDVTSSDACQMREGIQLIEQHPLQYLLLTPLEFVRLTFYVYPSKLALIRNWTVWAGLVTLVVCLASRRFRTPERTWLAFVILAYTLPSIAGDTQPRYGVPMVPFYSLFAAAGLVWVVQRYGRTIVARLQLGRRGVAAPHPS